MAYVVLTGGTGGAKLVHGLKHEVDPEELTIICNTADDIVLHGLHISPDLDTIMYQLAELSDESKGWGLRDDTFAALEQLERYGCETWFKLGDKDLATHMRRTELLRAGLRLSAVTRELCRALGIKAKLLPMSDERVETVITTKDGEISFQEYFVRHQWRPEVTRVTFSGIEDCCPAPGILDSVYAAEVIVVCPSNPVTSIGPILAVPGVREALQKTAAPVVAVTPMIGREAISGPAHKLLAATGSEPSALGVARRYADFLDGFVVDHDDLISKKTIEQSGIKVSATSVRMTSLADKRRLAREVLAFAAK